MAKHVTIQHGRNINQNGAITNQAQSESRAEATPLAHVKMPYAVAAVVVSLACLWTAVVHARRIGGDHELSISQARLQAHHKWGGIKPPIPIGQNVGRG